MSGDIRGVGYADQTGDFPSSQLFPRTIRRIQEDAAVTFDQSGLRRILGPYGFTIR